MRYGAALICATILTVTSTACGGAGGDPSKNGTNTEKSAGQVAGEDGAADFTAEPVQLKDDPCSLVTKTETEALIGPVNDPARGTGDSATCVYVSSKNTGGQLAVTLNSLTCQLLFLALDENIFGGSQVRRDDIGDGGMLVKGNGNVQFVVNGGCVEVDANVDRDTKVDDETMLQLAKTAAGRVS